VFFSSPPSLSDLLFVSSFVGCSVALQLLAFATFSAFRLRLVLLVKRPRSFVLWLARFRAIDARGA